jgi:hypothetical protein
MTTAANCAIMVNSKFQLHIDGGANRSITADSGILLNFRNIKPYTISGVNKDDITVVCTGIGYLPWRAPDGTMLLVKCYYSDHAANTIISPSDIVLNHLSEYSSWTQHSNLSTGTGYIDFITHQNQRVRFPLYAQNGLWYYHSDNATDYNPDNPTHIHTPIVNRLNAAGLYELFHARMGHPGQKTMYELHKHLDGIPKLKQHPMFKCATCLQTKATKRALTAKAVTDALQQGQLASDTPPVGDNDMPPSNDSTTGCKPGERFHMDMGFVRGTQFSYKDEDGWLVTSLDGYNSYLIVVDRATRYTWVFLTRNKTPQVDTIKKFLEIHGSKHATQKYIRTDEGGELWRSHAFQQMIRDAGYILEPTAADASF